MNIEHILNFDHFLFIWDWLFSLFCYNTLTTYSTLYNTLPLILQLKFVSKLYHKCVTESKKGQNLDTI